jgi:hypothetical protein
MSAPAALGFHKPEVLYGWGALDELAHRPYRAGWFLARAQGVACHYLPTSTQGHELSFDDYWRRARRFAFDYFRERHGEHWDELFWSATSAHKIEVNAFREHKRLWAGAFTPSELLERTGGDVAPAIEATAPRGERTRPARTDARGLEAWPLATQAAQRLLAWPDYTDAGELEQLFDSFARPLVGRSEVCLCLRFDESIDGSEPSVVERLQQAFERTLGAQAPLEILLIDDEIEMDQLPRLGAAIAGFADLPSAAHGPRAEFLRATGASALSGGDALRLRLEQLCTPRYGRDVLDQVDFNLVNAAASAARGRRDLRRGRLERVCRSLPDTVTNLIACRHVNDDRQTAVVTQIERRRAHERFHHARAGRRRHQRTRDLAGSGNHIVWVSPAFERLRLDGAREADTIDAVGENFFADYKFDPEGVLVFLRFLREHDHEALHARLRVGKHFQFGMLFGIGGDRNRDYPEEYRQ